MGSKHFTLRPQGGVREVFGQYLPYREPFIYLPCRPIEGGGEVVYSNSRILFNETEYHVPNGVETICSHAFALSKRYLTLSVPSSIKVIGDSLFGKEGGRIIIRRE